LHPSLQDLRFLHMAKQLEAMFEGLERAFERHIPQGAVRTVLRPIFEAGPAHQRLEDAYVRVNHEVAQGAADVQAIDLLECILACEKAAQKFYADHAHDLKDPVLARLFQDLAAEEGRHVLVVQETLRLQRAVG
jgi:hypothetical protein